MFTVFYKKERNLHISHYQSESGRVGSRAFKTYAQALEFSKTVDTTDIYSHTGKALSF